MTAHRAVPIVWGRDRPSPAERRTKDEQPASREGAGDERWVRCAACGAAIAPEAARVEIGGAHEHAFMNPSAIRFVVQCFASAPGCAPDGERETVWSWFPGHAWQIARCRACLTHVGWSFHAPSGAAFWALVRERLA